MKDYVRDNLWLIAGIIVGGVIGFVLMNNIYSQEFGSELSIQQWMNKYEVENGLPLTGTKVVEPTPADRDYYPSPPNPPEEYIVEVPQSIIYVETQLFEALPEWVQYMAPDQYREWAKAQNEMAYYTAKQRASQQSFGRSVNQTNIYTYRGLDGYRWHFGPSATSIDSQTWTPNQWGGGPIILLNPYCHPRK